MAGVSGQDKLREDRLRLGAWLERRILGSPWLPTVRTHAVFHISPTALLRAASSRSGCCPLEVLQPP